MRPIAVALLAGPSLALAACGGGADQSDEPTGVPSEAAAPSEASPMASASPAPSPSASAKPSPTPSASATPAAGGMAAAASTPVAFNQCKACHSVKPGDNGIGPSLAGVYGDKAAKVPGFDFSDAMTNSGLTWNAATLDRYLENPQGVVPGTQMSFAGLKDAAKRKAVIDYLKTL